MQLLKWFCALVVGVVIVLFAIANRSMVTLSFNPLPASIEIPLFIIIFIGALLGFVLGGLLASMKNVAKRRTLNQQQKKIVTLEKELAVFRPEQQEPGNTKDVVEEI